MNLLIFVAIVIVGNKYDMPEAKKFDFSQAEKYATSIGGIAVKASAKTGEGIHHMKYIIQIHVKYIIKGLRIFLMLLWIILCKTKMT